MIPARFDDITADHILRLVEEKISERKTLDYKQALVLNPDEKRVEFLADVCSFANASGGDLIYGVAEERDGGGNATGIPGQLTPLAIDNPATECARIEQLIATGIQPRIPVAQVKAIPLPEGGCVIVLRIGKSWISPHMVTYANRSRFYSRNSSTGKFQLDVQQIGAAFTQQQEMADRLKMWKADRIAKAVSGDGPVGLHGPTVLLHLVSAVGLGGAASPSARFWQTESTLSSADGRTTTNTIPI